METEFYGYLVRSPYDKDRIYSQKKRAEKHIRDCIKRANQWIENNKAYCKNHVNSGDQEALSRYQEGIEYWTERIKVLENIQIEELIICNPSK